MLKSQLVWIFGSASMCVWNAEIYSVIQCQRPLKSMSAECIKETVAQLHVIKLLCVCVCVCARVHACVCVCVEFLRLAVSSNLYDQGNVCLTN